MNGHKATYKKSGILILAFIFLLSVLRAQPRSANISIVDKQIDSLLKIVWENRNNDPEKVLPLAYRAIKLSDSIKNYYLLAKSYSFTGTLYKKMGLYHTALKYFKLALEVSQKYNIKTQLGYSFNNLGNIYLYLNLPIEAVKFLKLADSISKQVNNPSLQSYIYLNLGRAYIKLNNPQIAITFIRKALLIRKEYLMVKKLSICYKYMADAYQMEGEYRLAYLLYKKTQDLSKLSNDQYLLIDLNLGLSQLFINLNKLDSAYKYARIAYKLSKKDNFKYRRLQAVKQMAKIYSLKKNYKLAYYYEKKAFDLEKQIHKKQILSTLKSIEFNEKLRKQHLQLIQLKRQWEYERIISRRKSIIITLSIISSLLLIAFIIVLIKNSNKIKRLSEDLKISNKRLKQLNLELKEQASKLQKTNKELSEREQIIRESVNFAQNILNALMGSIDVLKSFAFISQYFLIFKPLHVISGDFYYFKDRGRFKAIVVGDSTGHGIPGAFISIVSISLLNDLLYKNSKNYITAAYLLDEFREQIIKVLNLDREEFKHVKVGVDLALCLFYEQEQVVHFAGAYHNLYVFKNSELTVYKGTRTSAGSSIVKLDFENHVIPLSQIDRIYMFTDGIIDQFGGENNFKLTRRRWLSFLTDLQTLSMHDQKHHILQFFEQWKGDQEQTDDILILGIEINHSFINLSAENSTNTTEQND